MKNRASHCERQTSSVSSAVHVERCMDTVVGCAINDQSHPMVAVMAISTNHRHTAMPVTMMSIWGQVGWCNVLDTF